MAASKPASPNDLGNLVRLTPLRLHELPTHPSIPDTKGDTQRPDLLTFLVAILDEGAHFLAPSSISSTFQSVSTKQTPPSTAPTEVLKRSIPLPIFSTLNWSNPPIPRTKPTSLEAEHWFMRRSIHANISSKTTKGSANWDEFVYGLRDEHSRHEFDFTPTLYDAHHILDWNDAVHALEAGGKLGGKYSSITMSVYEMCHAIPPPLQPRCFPVLVLTASTSPTAFLAVTIPLDLTTLPSAFYSSGRNSKEGSDQQQRKTPVMGAYAAVETVRIVPEGQGEKRAGEIEWTMATASNARGNLPMWVQKMSMPGAVPKDVQYFMEWICGVPESEIAAQKVGTH